MSVYYKDDNVTLYLGDCLTEHLEWLDADVLVTDPPYGMGYVDWQGLTVTNDETVEARNAMMAAWGGQRPALVFGTWRVERPQGTKQVLIWDKSDGNGPGNGRTSPWGLSHEEIYVLGKWPPIVPGGRWREGGKPARSSGVLRAANYNTQSSDRPDHPTPKPIGLMQSLIEKCPPGVIADPFAGSGSTLVAAKALGRRAIGVELEERYCELAARRLAQDVLDFGALA
jgi:site-specific DNA-methyltransferase (adenine-specific)